MLMRASRLRSAVGYIGDLYYARSNGVLQVSAARAICCAAVARVTP